MSSSTDTTPTQIYTLSLHDALPICNPQNMLIGSFSGIGYRDFGAALAPVALAGLVMVVVIIALVYRGEFRRTAARVEIEPPPVRVHGALAWKSTVASAVIVGRFFLSCLV